MKEMYLGIDTSNYRTSAAVVDSDGKILSQKAVLLDVPAGKRGLRQSDAFFMHSNRLPGYIEELFGSLDPACIKAVGVSERPRRTEGSYMPCFLAGINASREIAAALKVPVFCFSHQEGHAAAVMESDGKTAASRTLFFHLSGGTTEALICIPDDKGYSMEIVGGTRDISAGQLIDRFGVAIGMPFPSGKYLDDIAFRVLERADFKAKNIERSGAIPAIRIDDGYFNLSGAETRLMRYIDTHGTASAEDVTAELFASVSELLIKDAQYLSEKYFAENIYMAGGVASSRTFRVIVQKSSSINIQFGDPDLSGDNAVGAALLAKRVYETGNSNSGK
ncbi:MAG: DNA-binding protein [Mogibacterium sp.]|nr:DNA-binding protein [Mogibacterium sp.]